MGEVDWPARSAAARAFIGEGLGKKKAWTDLHYAYDYQEGTMLFLHCYDDNPKKPVAQRLTEAVAGYEARMGTTPNLILVNEQDADATFPGCVVKAEKRIGPNIYHVGRAE